MTSNNSASTHYSEQNKILFRALVGNSPGIHKVHKEILQVAACDANVLISGESGTGKEVVARNVHFHSKRSDKPFVPINCGAIPHDLLESELFGHEKGAFTGAITSRQGRFAMAEGGTLFLDEIGEMTMAMQVKLLRVLEERVYERVGSTTRLPTDVRILSATNRNLEDMIKEGTFREDLYFRLDVFPIHLPSLRERMEDLPLLVNELIARMEKTKNCSVRLDSSALKIMSQYDWPGNVRELANHLERLAIKYPNGVVKAHQLPDKIRAKITEYINSPELNDIKSLPNSNYGQPFNTNIPQIHIPTDGIDLKTYISNIEVMMIQNALESSGGIIANAAKLLGLQRTTLSEKMRKYHIDRRMSDQNCTRSDYI